MFTMVYICNNKTDQPMTTAQIKALSKIKKSALTLVQKQAIKSAFEAGKQAHGTSVKCAHNCKGFNALFNAHANTGMTNHLVTAWNKGFFSQVPSVNLSTL